jgi:hypothetical protein
MFKLARWAGSAFVTLIAAYVFFFVPIGRRTLYDHTRRIATTPEAREFGDEMRIAGARVAERTRDEVEGVIRHGVLPPDAGTRDRARDEPGSPPPPHLSSNGAQEERVPVTVTVPDGGVSITARPTVRSILRAARGR